MSLAVDRKGRRKRYFIYIVTDALSENPQIEVLRGPCDFVKDGQLALVPIVYELDLRKKPDGTS